MPRVSVANNAKLSWLLLRGGLRQAIGRINGHPLLRWPLPHAQSRPAADCATGSAHRRRDPRRRNLCRPLLLRRQGRDLRRPLDLRDGAAIGRMGAALLGFRLAAPFARRRFRRSRAPMRARWSTNGSSCKARGIRSAWRPDVLSRRIISWLSQATLVLEDADARFYRRFVRSLVRQVRYLRHTARDARAALPACRR